MMTGVNITPPSSRVDSIDTLRGLAVLGILPVNIQSYSMITAAYQNPAAYGDLGGWNYWVWLFTYSLFDSKFLALFSLLFGASLLLIQQHREHLDINETHNYQRRRLFILVAIGLFHAYLIWPGDILVTYGICGLILLPALKLSPRPLVILGLIVMSLPSLLMLNSMFNTESWGVDDWIQARSEWQPPPEAYQYELDAYQGDWLTQQKQRTYESVSMHIQTMPFWLVWRAGGLILVGMALFKLGILSAERSKRFYLTMMIVGFGLGLPIALYNGHEWSQTGWSLYYFSRQGFQINYWLGLLTVGGYIGLVMWLHRTSCLPWLTYAISRVGRMALTNYLLQSLICTFIFYGHGLGLFGKMARTGQLGVVIAVWLVSVLLSVLWLGIFRHGPIEWIWRKANKKWLRRPVPIPA